MQRWLFLLRSSGRFHNLVGNVNKRREQKAKNEKKEEEEIKGLKEINSRIERKDQEINKLLQEIEQWWEFK